ncbi:hypothetical protein AURDEDRAFT_61566 [Auricularia subglabra TFB-10046 SS5]|nr:hypothetical protein AURDEDRAFT_61566 [Auricularia subglabra TFB-10046 SS5]
MGDPGSPLAFLLYISDFTTTDHPDDVILAGTRVSHLEHADDIAIFSTSEAGLQLKLNELAAWASLNQMQISLKKTVAMVFRRTNAVSNVPRPTLRLNGELLTVVQRQQYVGVMFASDCPNMWDAHFDLCERRARAAVNRIFFIESHTGSLPPWEGRILYRAQIDPHLTWGCGITGCGTLKQLDGIEDVQHYFLRRLLGVQKRSQLLILFTETGLWPLRWRRLDLQLRYLEYLLQLPDGHIAKAAVQQCIRDPRSRTWMYGIREPLSKLGLSLPESPSQQDVTAAVAELKKAVGKLVKSQLRQSGKLDSDVLQSRRDFSSGVAERSPALAFRSYLRISSKEMRVALTRLLVSEHSLSRLNWRDGRNYTIPPEKRLCRFCLAKPETPVHALFECVESNDLVAHRRAFWRSVTRSGCSVDLHTMRNLGNMDLLHALLSHRDSIEPLALLATHVMAVYSQSPRYIARAEECT